MPALVDFPWAPALLRMLPSGTRGRKGKLLLCGPEHGGLRKTPDHFLGLPQELTPLVLNHERSTSEGRLLAVLQFCDSLLQDCGPSMSPGEESESVSKGLEENWRPTRNRHSIFFLFIPEKYTALPNLQFSPEAKRIMSNHCLKKSLWK